MTKILVIEDEISIRDGLAGILRFEGHEVVESENGHHGILMALRHRPDLILCDIMMPGIDGYETLKRIRLHDELKLIPFVFLTARAEKTDMRKGMTTGASDYLTKPFSRDDLISMVNTQLRKAAEIAHQQQTAMEELRNNVIQSLPHELKTPLNGLIGFGQLLKDFPGTFSQEEIHSVGNHIFTSAMRLYRLIQNYLYYIHLEYPGKNVYQDLAICNPVTFFEQVAVARAAEYGRRNDLVINCTNARVNITETEFIKIIEEITDNAFKFSEAGSTVTLDGILDGSVFRIVITDQGVGMSASEIARIGAYMQFNRQMREQQGTGLGLAIIRKVVAIFEGTMNVESQPGQGTTVTICLPGSSLHPDAG